MGLYNMKLKSKKITLDDKYTLEEGRVYITGTQALVRLPIIQRQKDKSQNLKWSEVNRVNRTNATLDVHTVQAINTVSNITSIDSRPCPARRGR